MLAGAVLVGCGDDDDDAAGPAQVAKDPGATVVPVRLGEPFDVLDDQGVKMATVTITAVELDPPCTTGVDYSGHLIGIETDIQTAAAQYVDAFGKVDGNDFQVKDANGYMVPQAEVDTDCGRPALSYDLFVADSKYRGWSFVESPTPTGTVLFKPRFIETTDRWSIEFPAASVPTVPSPEPPAPEPAPEPRSQPEPTYDDEYNIDPDMNVGPDGVCTGTPCGSNGRTPTCDELGLDPSMCGPDGSYQP